MVVATASISSVSAKLASVFVSFIIEHLLSVESAIEMPETRVLSDSVLYDTHAFL